MTHNKQTATGVNLRAK